VANYREGHPIYLSVGRGNASTENLRQAKQHYRSLFDDLLENPEEQPLSRDPRDPERTSDSKRSETRR
jgi:hypothetical protein